MSLVGFRLAARPVSTWHRQLNLRLRKNCRAATSDVLGQIDAAPEVEKSVRKPLWRCRTAQGDNKSQHGALFQQIRQSSTSGQERENYERSAGGTALFQSAPLQRRISSAHTLALWKTGGLPMTK